MIAKERQEQIEKHGYTVQSDVEWNTENQLIDAAVKLAGGDPDPDCPKRWETYDVWYRIIAKDKIAKLAIAGAFIAAEIDRLNAIENDKGKAGTTEGLLG